MTNSAEILLVDDIPDNLRLLSSILTDKGYEIRKALNGKMALASAQAHPPDLILLDIKMPGISGYEVCKQLKADVHTSEIPVIFISALDEVLDKVKAFKVGGVDYITKPFQPEEVLARVESQLNLRRLQRQLTEQNQQLQLLNEKLISSNKELEQFAYVVSHDLQQPLQSITGFAKIITLKYQNHLETEMSHYLTRIEDAGKRMQRLIKDLLDYCQIENQQQQFELIDCNLVLKQVLDNLHLIISEKAVNINIDSLPTVIGNETQLIQLFQNLMTNAIKFVAPDILPQIKIFVEPKNNKWMFGIQDNGIGIKSGDLEHIFKVFHRLHSTQKYAGTGIGLATCKKIVERHGGDIWVESQPGIGTTFFFTI